MSVKSWNSTRMSSSSRLIPEWKDLKLLIDNKLKDIKADRKPKNDVVVLSDWPETLYQEPHHPRSKPFICFYSINANYFVSLNWVEPSSKETQAVLWVQEKDLEMAGMIEKTKFNVMDQVPPIEAMVHTGSYHMLIAYCGDMHLWLFGDHHQAFTPLGTVPCRFSISCLCYDSEAEMLLSGTLGAVVTWFISPNGRGLEMAQAVPLPGCEFVQGFSLNGPRGSLLALCENKVRVFTHQGQGRLEEVKKFIPVGSGSSITCSFTCVSQGYLYAGNRNGEIHAWGLDQGNFLHSFQAHSSSVICIHSRPEAHTLLTAGSEGVVREWNLAFGNLLRQLNIAGDLQQLQFIDNTAFFCQTTYTFSLYRLPYFYSLFNVCGSPPQQVQRVCCGHNWTRILCATKDGLLRFLSPVTGDLLVITWPLLVMDKAVAWAYDSDREELFVATDSPEVLVFDATRSPCTAKYLVCTSVNHEDRVRCLAYAQSCLGKGLVGLMFCGHESGIVRILSHYSCARTEKTVHSGAVLALSTLEGPQEDCLLCSYSMDNVVHLTEAVLQGNKVTLKPVSKIFCSSLLTYVILLPGSVGAITENNCWRLWHYQDFPTSSGSEQSSRFKETKRLHECAITSFDVCLSLKLFVTGGTDGSVRIWDFHGRLITELDSALHFGPLCFANNRGDLLVTFNQSLYLVSCLKLLHPARLTHLTILNSADHRQEAPKPFLPSFFFSFETVFVPKFVYLGQGLQELQGLEALVNKRVIAFDNTVPHVVEEERHMSSVIPEGSKSHILEDKGIDSSTLDSRHNRPLHVVPAQLRLAGWDGLKPYHMLRCFFGHGRQWPLAPDGYIPNSVIRARLWPEGTPIFLRCDLYPSYRDEERDKSELSPMTLTEEKISMGKQEKKPRKGKRSFFDVLLSMKNQNWMGKFDERLINNAIEAILSLTICCSVEQYKTYISVLAKTFANYEVPSKLRSEAACRFLEDTTYSNPRIRELAWEALERLGLISHLFAIPLAVGLMDSNENVRAKALYLMIRVTGIQTKTMLVGLLKKPETLQEMQKQFIGEASLDQLLGIQAKDIQWLLTQVQQRLKENLTLSRGDQEFTFSLDRARASELEALYEETRTPFSEHKKIIKPRRRTTHIQARSRYHSKKDLKVSRKQRRTESVKFSPVLVESEDQGEQREARKSGQTDTQDVALEPEPTLSTFSPVGSQEDAESQEVALEATEATEAQEVMEVMKAIDQHGMKEDEEVIPTLQKQQYVKGLWKSALKKGHENAYVKLKEKKHSEVISETPAEEPKEEVVQVTEQEEDTRKKSKKSSHGLAGIPGRASRSDTRSWRDDICYLVTSRIASTHPGMLRDLGQELVDLAQVMLASRQPSWDLFQEICPLLKDSSELDDRGVEEKEKVVREVKEERTVGWREQRGEKLLKKGKALFEKVKKKKISFSDHLVLEKRKLKKGVRELARREGKIAEEERKLSKPERKLVQGKEKLTKDKKKLTHQEGKIAGKEEILAFPQKILTKKLGLGEKKWTGREGRLPGKRERVTRKDGKATPERRKWDREQIMLAQEEGVWAQEEGLPVWEERKLSQEEEELGEEEEELSEEEEELGEEEEELGEGEEELGEEEEELGEEEEELGEGEEELGEEEEELGEEEEELGEEEEELGEEEEELGEEEEELGEEEEELAWEEELILDIQKQAEEWKKVLRKRRHIWSMEKLVEEEAWKRGKLAQEKEYLSREEEGLSGKDRKQALKRANMAKQEITLTQEKKKWLVNKKKEAHKEEQTQEKKKQDGKQEKEDQKERQAKKEEKQAKDKQLAWQRKKPGLEEEEPFGEMEKLSQEGDKKTQKKETKAWEKERRAREEEKTTEKKKQQARVKKKMDLGEEKQAEEMERWSQEEKKQAQKEKRWDQKEEKLAQKVEKEAEGKKQGREKMKLIPEEEKMKEIEEVSPKEKKQAMEKEKQAKKEEKKKEEIKEVSPKEKKQPMEKEKQAKKEEKKTEEIEEVSPKEKKQAMEKEKQAKKEEKKKEEIEEVSRKEKKQAMEKEKEPKKEEKKKEEIEEVSPKEKKQAMEKGKQAKKEEKKTEEIEEVPPKEKKQAMEKEKQAKKEEKKKEETEEVTPKERKQAMEKEKQAKKEEKKKEETEEVSRKEKKQAMEKGKQAKKEEKKTEEIEEVTSKERKQAMEKEKQAKKEEKKKEETEEVTPKERKQAMEKEKQAKKEEKKTEEIEEVPPKEKKQAMEKEKQAKKEEKKKEEIEEVTPKERKQAMEKEKQAKKEEKKKEEIKEVSPKEKKQAMEKEKQTKKEEKWVGQDKKAIEEKKQWTYEKGQLALQEEKQAQKERIQGQKEEKESEQKKQWAWEKERLSLEEEEQAGDMEKRLTQEGSKVAKEERHIAKKGKAKAKEGIGITKRKKKTTQEEKEVVKEEGKPSQEERKLAYDIRTKETAAAEKKKKRTKEERIEAMRKLDMEKGISSEDKEASSREKDIRKKESQLLRILAKTIREISTATLEETEILEEKRSFIMERSEIDDQRWEFFKEQEEITTDEKELAQKERKLEDDRLATKERTLTDEESLEEDQRLLQKAQENTLLDKIQVQSILKEVQEQNLLGKKQLKKLVKRVENKPEKTWVKWLLKNIRGLMLEGLSESLIKKEIEEGPTKKGKEEESLTEEGEEEELLPQREKRKHLIKKQKKKVSLSEEKLEENLAKKPKSSAQRRKKEKRLLPEKERLRRKETEGPHEEAKEHLSKEEEESLSEEESPSGEESLSEEEEESLSEEEKESPSEEEESPSEEKESLSEEEKESLSEEEKESPSEEEESLSEDEESLSEEEKESPSEEEEESPSEEEESLSEDEESLSEEEKESPSEEEEESPREEEESLSEDEESLSEEEKESPSEEEESLSEDEESLSEEEKESPSEEEEESPSEEEEESPREEEGEESLSKDEEKESRLMEAVLLEERVLKTELAKEEVSLLKPVTEGDVLTEERERRARREMPFKKERLPDGRREPTLMDTATWTTFLKSPFKIPLPVVLEKEEGMPLKVLGDHLDLEAQENRLLGARPMTSSWRRQEDVLLEKARGMFLQVMETGLETQFPEGLHRPEFHLSETRKPQKPEWRTKGGRWKWDSLMGKTEYQAPAPAPAPSLTSMPAQSPCYSEASLSDEDWINNALIRLEAGQQLSRDSFHRLSQLLRHLTSKGYVKWTNLSNLKAIAKHLRQNLELSHTDIARTYKDVLSPVHLQVIPPIRRKEKGRWLELFPIPEPVSPSATKRTQTAQTLNWHLLAESYRRKQAQQLSTAVKEIRQLYPVRKEVPTAIHPSVDKKSLSWTFQKDFWALRGRSELPQIHKAKKKALPIPAPVLPSTTKRIQVPKAINWHLLGEPYRSARAQQIASALKDMEMRHFYPDTRDISTSAHASVDKQTLALMFQKDLRAFKGKGRPLKLPQLEKKPQPISKIKEAVPQWETFVALYHVLRMLQQRYAKDSTAWMEQFHQLMDLYQLKSPRIQRLLLELLHRKELQPQETIYNKALKTKELVLGERVLYDLFCGSSHAPGGPLKFQKVIPLPGQNKVHTIQPVGIAQYGFLELAWKSLPQVNPYLIERPPTTPTRPL
ncbi:WD repeat-containing protein 87-like [Equus przewalskii]|uniref:WD repeat-containing protein 87-like n=1 Tax=Equus przewalskii TaxID=9798 RepID=A0ABM4JCR5_EQUPR